MIALRKQPLFIIMLGLLGFVMVVPMLYATVLENWLIARTFFYHGLIYIIVALMLAIAFSGRELSDRSASRIVDVTLGFILLPFLMGLPVQHLVPQLSLFDAYFEMLSSFTTTGATVMDFPGVIPDTVHLWRALVAWLGGFLMLVFALTVFMPINLGGFEVYAKDRQSLIVANRIKRADVRARLIRYSKSIFPIYFGLTASLGFLLFASGDRMVVAAIHAMSTLSTSGISPLGGLEEANSGFLGEAFVALFLLCAVSRFVFQQDDVNDRFRQLRNDKELNLMLVTIILIPGLLFFRHWVGAQDFDEDQDILLALQSLWGSMFTVLSFLTTTGFESQSWETARDWSGLNTPGIIFMGLAVMGGGIATTAGGVKLLRIYALYKHGVRELERLSFPNSVGGAGSKARAIRREGAYAAWIFFMLFLISIAIVMVALSATGLGFQDSMVLAIAALSNTGPLLEIAGSGGETYASVSTAAKAILCATMILGRMEALAIIAILNPEFWRK